MDYVDFILQLVGGWVEGLMVGLVGGEWMIS